MRTFAEHEVKSYEDKLVGPDSELGKWFGKSEGAIRQVEAGSISP